MKTLIKSIIVIVVLLLSGCYVRPVGAPYGVVGVRGNSYNNGYYTNGYNSSYYNNGYYDKAYNNGSQYRSGYQNNYSDHDRNWGENHNRERGEHHYDNGFRGSNYGGQNWQGRQSSGHRGWH